VAEKLTKTEPIAGPELESSDLRAWLFLIWLSIKRQARARMMVWIALGLLGITAFIIFLNARADRFGMTHWRYPHRQGPYYFQFLAAMQSVQWNVPWDISTVGVLQAATGSIRVTLSHGSGFYVFSTWVAFFVFATFLLPLWSLSFATEGLGREREARNLIWVLTRPLPRPAIYLAKYLAALPWCLALNVGGFGLLCWTAGPPGRLAFPVYWPAVFWATLAFCSLFHLMGALFRRPAIVAILYSFFLETVLGNLPGHMKRFSIGFYTRCLMLDRGHDFGIRPDRPWTLMAVDGRTALLVLAGITAFGLVLGMLLFSRREYLEVT
jgi:ABC-2 type transport system permease protein